MLPNFEYYVVEEEEGSGIKSDDGYWNSDHISASFFTVANLFIAVTKTNMCRRLWYCLQGKEKE